MTAHTRELVLFSNTDLSEVPDYFRLLRWGLNETLKGPYLVDQAAAETIVANWRDQGVDIVIDRDHQTLGGQYASPDGTAPAMGWIKRLTLVPGDGVYAHVDWTPKARQLLTNREYRYLSPVLKQDAADLRATRIHSVGLTNKPATLHADALVNKEDSSESGSPDRLAIIAKEKAAHAAAVKRNGADRVVHLATWLNIALRRDGQKALTPQEEREHGGDLGGRAVSLSGPTATKGRARTMPNVPSRAFKAAHQALSDSALVSKALADRKILDTQIAWFQRLVLTDRDTALYFMESAIDLKPFLRSAQDEPRDERSRTIAAAAAEWDSEPGLAQLVTRCGYIDGELRTKNLMVLTDAERHVNQNTAGQAYSEAGAGRTLRLVCSGDAGRESRQDLILSAAREFDEAARSGAALTTRHAWVDDSLRQRGMAALSDSERANVVDHDGSHLREPGSRQIVANESLAQQMDEVRMQRPEPEDERAKIVEDSGKEWDKFAANRRSMPCSRHGWISATLGEKGHKPLTAEEKRTIQDSDRGAASGGVVFQK